MLDELAKEDFVDRCIQGHLLPLPGARFTSVIQFGG
jgi:hypothetical protein